MLTPSRWARFGGDGCDDRRISRPLGIQAARRLVVPACLVAGGLLLVVFATRPLGLGAAIPGCILVVGGTYDLPRRLRTRRQREPRRPSGAGR